MFMVISFVCARERVRSTSDAACIRAWQKCLTCEIALSGGAPAAAMTSSFADSFKVTAANLIVER